MKTLLLLPLALVSFGVLACPADGSKEAAAPASSKPAAVAKAAPATSTAAAAAKRVHKVAAKPAAEARQTATL